MDYVVGMVPMGMAPIDREEVEDSIEAFPLILLMELVKLERSAFAKIGFS